MQTGSRRPVHNNRLAPGLFYGPVLLGRCPRRAPPCSRRSAATSRDMHQASHIGHERKRVHALIWRK